MQQSKSLATNLFLNLLAILQAYISLVRSHAHASFFDPHTAGDNHHCRVCQYYRRDGCPWSALGLGNHDRDREPGVRDAGASSMVWRCVDALADSVAKAKSADSTKGLKLCDSKLNPGEFGYQEPLVHC